MTSSYKDNFVGIENIPVAIKNVAEEQDVNR